MKPAIVAAGVVVAACAVVLGGAAASGVAVQKKLQAMPAAVNAEWPMVRVTADRYDRSLFGATHTVTLRVGCDAPDAAASAPQVASITIVQHVKHGPFPGFKGFGAATVDTELVLDDSMREQVRKVFGTSQPFQSHTDVTFSGASHTHFAIAPFHATGPQGEQADFQGVTGDIDNSASALEYDVRMPSVSVAQAASASAGVQMALKGAHLHGRAQGSGDLALRPGTGQAEVESLDVAVAAPQGGATHEVGFSQVKFSQDTSVDKNLMGAIGRGQAQAQIDDTKFDKIEFQVTVKRFDAAAYRGIVRRFWTDGAQACGKAPDPGRLMASREVQDAVLQILSANPEFSLDKLLVEVSGKRAELGYALGVSGFTAADAKLPLQASLMSRGYGNLHLKLPEDWVQKSLSWVAQQAGQASGATDQAAMAELMLGKVIDQGFVLREDGMLKTELEFRNGQAAINGKPVGRPMAGAGDGVAAPAM